MQAQRLAGGGLLRDLVEGVAKEAPELSRGAAARNAVINIGLDINGGERLHPQQALAALERFGVKPISAHIAQSDSEPTLVIELDRSLRPHEAHALSAELQQEAIAQVDHNGVGDLHGPEADKWKPFNGDYFIDHTGKRLTQSIMDAGNDSSVPGGADPVLDHLKELSAQLQGQPIKKAGGGLIEDAAKMLVGAAEHGEAKIAAVPQRLYHGTKGGMGRGFDSLDPNQRSINFGLHVGTKPQADYFASGHEHLTDADIMLNKDYYANTAVPNGGRMVQLDMHVKNPIRLEDRTGTWQPSEVYKQLVDLGKVPYNHDTYLTLRENQVRGPEFKQQALDSVRKMIEDAGHDSIVYTNRVEGYTTDDPIQSRFQKRGIKDDRSLNDQQWLDVVPEAKGNDSHIVWKPGTYKSPFGEGKGVGYAVGGEVRQRYANAGLVEKLGKGIVDLLDFSAPAVAKDVRGSVVNGTELRGDGRKFREFFGDVTSGKSDKYKPSGLDNYNPAIELGPDAAAFRRSRDGYSGNFDNHIKTSIPGFDETQNAVGSALLKTYGQNGADILDIGSSEGALIKALSAGSDGRIRTTGIDPNPDMLRTYNERPQVAGSRSILSAFGSADDAGKTAWEEGDGTKIPYFDPQGQKFDAAHEAMVFQFISNARRAQAERVKQLLKNNGLAIFEEKYGGPKHIFDANEAKKDLYKGQYYTPEQMDIKRREVLNGGGDAVEGMTDLQVSQAEMEHILRDTFRHRAQFWDSGNFKGYAASDDKRALEDYLNNLQSLHSD